MDFELANKCGNRIRTVFCKNKKFMYYSSERKHNDKPLTFEEIYNMSKPYFDKYVKQYEDYKIQRKPITNSIFRLSVFYSPDRKNFVDYHNEKILYEIEIDNKNENKIIFEYKNSNLIENEKKPISFFCVKIEVKFLMKIVSFNMMVKKIQELRMFVLYVIKINQMFLSQNVFI